MDFNDLIFPSPKPSYDYTLSGLYYIEEEIQYHRSRSLIQQNELKTYQGTIKVTLNQSESTRQLTQNRKTKRIVTLLQLEENLRNGIIVYFHANAEDIGMCKSLAFLLAAELEMASICMEYPGYGIYHGQSSSDTIIKDAYLLIDHLINNLKVHESKIIIMGRSIGTSIAVEMSIRYKRIKALVLLSPFTSLCDVIKENSFNWVSKLVKERFRNLEKMHKVHSPTLFIHGIVIIIFYGYLKFQFKYEANQSLLLQINNLIFLSFNLQLFCLYFQRIIIINNISITMIKKESYFKQAIQSL